MIREVYIVASNRLKLMSQQAVEENKPSTRSKPAQTDDMISLARENERQRLRIEELEQKRGKETEESALALLKKKNYIVEKRTRKQKTSVEQPPETQNTSLPLPSAPQITEMHPENQILAGSHTDKTHFQFCTSCPPNDPTCTKCQTKAHQHNRNEGAFNLRCSGKTKGGECGHLYKDEVEAKAALSCPNCGTAAPFVNLDKSSNPLQSFFK